MMPKIILARYGQSSLQNRPTGTENRAVVAKGDKTGKGQVTSLVLADTYGK